MIKFGIVGGHGAVASAHFHTQLIEAYLQDGAYEDEHFPSFIISNYPEKTIDSSGEIDDYTNVSRLLTQTVNAMRDIDYCLVLCNTFHSPQVNIATKAQRLNLPQITAQEGVASGAKRPLVVASSTSNKSRLYDNPAYDPVYLDAGQLIELGMRGSKDHPLLSVLIEKARLSKCDSIILGCTDLTRFASQLRTMTNLPVIDSVESAVKKVKELDNESV